MSFADRARGLLEGLYSVEETERIIRQLTEITQGQQPVERPVQLDQSDVMLIAYGDHIQRSGGAPLQALHHFLRQYAVPQIRNVHILPFYPYSSDDGFSVIDYYAVDPALGDWRHIGELGAEFRLMFDAVFNHMSAQSEWFAAYLRGEPPYDGYFISLLPDVDLSQVVRPRTTPLLTPFEAVDGTRYVWTTFSADQVDLNIANPDVLLMMMDVLLTYVAKGATFIRLDAIAFMWKEIGTTSIHLPGTHRIIQLMRLVLDVVAPQVILITETNVPHSENISYFGDGTNEAQLVYQFPLPPLILHTLHTEDSTHLTQWAQSLEPPSQQTTFFNFTASHDGVGVRPVTGILSDDELNALVQRTLDHGGRVSYRSLADGSRSPYELNITYFNAINHPDDVVSEPEIAIDRFMLSQAIALSLAGLPAIYLPSLFGAQNDYEGLKATGHNRTINRQKFDLDQLVAELSEQTNLKARVYSRYRHLLSVRSQQPAFHPLGRQMIHDMGPSLFVVERHAPDGKRLLAIHNVTSTRKKADLDRVGAGRGWVDVLNPDHHVIPSGQADLAGYQVMWLIQP